MGCVSIPTAQILCGCRLGYGDDMGIARGTREVERLRNRASAVETNHSNDGTRSGWVRVSRDRSTAPATATANSTDNLNSPSHFSFLFLFPLTIPVARRPPPPTAPRTAQPCPRSRQSRLALFSTLGLARHPWLTSVQQAGPSGPRPLYESITPASLPPKAVPDPI